MLSRCGGLTRFLDDGRIEIGSTVVERSIRPIAILESLCIVVGRLILRHCGIENSLAGALARPAGARRRTYRSAPAGRAASPLLTIASDLIRRGAAKVIQLGELMMILELHRQGLSIAKSSSN